MTSLDFEDVRAARPVLNRPALKVAAVPAVQKPAVDCEVAIVGAGPYGLSTAAHLAARGVS
ncbi:MAG: FAD-dependent monooxygenase, partial [Proteobacteria bacterium]|nr:FAD-dependent monooxygenase [Pseudomonadota bacterium]